MNLILSHHETEYLAIINHSKNFFMLKNGVVIEKRSDGRNDNDDELYNLINYIKQ